MKEVIYCSRCTHPITRPRIRIDESGLCNGCLRTEEKKHIDWEAKEAELKELIQASLEKSPGREYDCIVPVSGGKDSTFQAYYASKVLNLRTLCVNITGFLPTKEGMHNLRNLSENLPVDVMSIMPNMDVWGRLSRKMLEDFGDPWPPRQYLMFSGIARIAIEKKIPLMLLGENGDREYGGSDDDAFTKLDNEGVHARIRSAKNGFLRPEHWTEYGFSEAEIAIYQEPSDTELRAAGVQRIFLSDYLPWNNNQHMHVALNLVGGFMMREDRSPGTYTFGYSIDDDLYDLYIWFTYPKFGFCRTTKYTSKDIQEGKITREQGIRMVADYDGEIPWRAVDRFLHRTDMTENEFWDVVAKFVGDEENLKREAEKFGTEMRTPAWEKIGERKWRLRNPIHGQERILELPMPRPLHNADQRSENLNYHF